MNICDIIDTMKKAIIFDCDGTMFDTEKVSKDAFRYVAKSINLELDDEFFNRIMGTTYDSICKELSKMPLMLEKFPEVARVWEEMIIDKTKVKDALAKDGLLELLDYLTLNNYKIAVASSSKLPHIERLINHLSKKYHFDAIVPGDTIKSSKPAPDIFLKAAEIIGVDPLECIVIEDSVNGVKAAKSANMTSIFIEDEVKFKDQDYKYVDIEFNSLNDVIEYIKSAD